MEQQMTTVIAQTAAAPLGDWAWVGMAFALAVAITWGVTPWVRRFATHHGAVDDPKRDERRIHRAAIPRWGGIAIFAGIIGSALITVPLAYPGSGLPPYVLAMILAGTLLAIFGAYDDLYQFRAKVQLAVLMVVGVGVQFLYSGEERIQIPSPGWLLGETNPIVGAWAWLAIPVTAFYLFIITKTMDTIDGVDGLAGGIACVSAVGLTILGVLGGQPLIALFAAAIAGAAIGFLRHNYHPASIFMGTGGAYVFGFSLACLSIVGAMHTSPSLALLVPFTLFGVPVMDALFVIVRRILARAPLAQADKRHTHHTLLAAGLNQKQTVWVLYSASALLCAILVLLVVRQSG